MPRFVAAGIRENTFLQLVEDWRAAELERGEVEEDVQAAVEAIKPFTEARRDRFADSSDLYRTLDAWRQWATSQEIKESKRALEGVLALWRAKER